MAIDLNGSNQYCEKALSQSSFPQTLSCFFNADDNSGINSIQNHSKYNTDQSSNYLRTNGDDFNAICVNTSGAGVSSSAINDSAVFGTWYHGAGYYTSDVSRTGWINGTAGSVATASRPVQTYTTYAIGYRNLTASSRGDYFNGKIADVSNHNVVLTQRELASRDAKVAAPLVRSAGMVSYIPLISSGQDWFSRTPFTLFNSPAYSRHPRVYL